MVAVLLALAGCPSTDYGDSATKPPPEANTVAPKPPPPPELRAALTSDGSTALGFDRANRAVAIIRGETIAYMTDGRVRLAFDNGVRAQFDRTADGARWLSLFGPPEDADTVYVFRTVAVPGGGTQVDIYEAPAATFNPSASGALTGLTNSSKARWVLKVLDEDDPDKSELREASSSGSWGDCFLNPDLGGAFGCLEGAIKGAALDHLNTITGGIAKAADRFRNALGWERWASMRLVANWSKNLTDVFRDGDIRTSDLLSNAVDWDGMRDTLRQAAINRVLRDALGNENAARLQRVRSALNLARDTVVPVGLLPELDPAPPKPSTPPSPPTPPVPPTPPTPPPGPNSPTPPPNTPGAFSLPALVQSGQVTFFAQSQSGFSQTRLKLTNQTGSTLPVDVSTAAFIPQVGSGQRVGLTRPISQFSGQADPEPDAPAAATNPPYVVELAPRATVDVVFSSRCLDHGRGSPSGSYAIFYTPLPDFIAQALRANMEQGQLWSLIDRTDPDWGADPRSNGQSYLFTFKNHTGGHLRLTARPFGNELTYALAPGQETTIEMAFRPANFEYEAEPSGAGEELTWSGRITPGNARNESLRLTTNNDYYVLRIRNNSSHRVRRMVTNRGLQSERTYTVDIPNDGALWNMGFHLRFSNSNLHLYDGTYHWAFSPVTYSVHSEHGYAYAEYTLVD